MQFIDFFLNSRDLFYCRLESQQQNHYYYHSHQTLALGNSTEQLVLPQHQHNGYHQLHQSHQMQQQSPQQQLQLQPQLQPQAQLNNSTRLTDEAPREILSVSGKKKCSYCSEELGKRDFICNFIFLSLGSHVKRHFPIFA